MPEPALGRRNMDNLSLLMERFPAIGILASTFSSGTSQEEPLEKWLGRLRLKEIELLYVYGLSIQAYLLLKNWLRESPKRRLVFLENEPTVFGTFLAQPEARFPLEDFQVELELLPSGKALEAALQALAEKHPIETLDVTALPSKNGPRFRALKLKLLRKTALTYALFLDRVQGFQLFENFLRNAPRIHQSFYANRLRGTFRNVPALICGAGPSLKAALPLIRTLENRALVFACGSAIAAFSAAGILPHFCVAIDPNLDELKRMKNSFAFEAPFLYSTRIHPGVFHTSNGPFGYMRSAIGGVPELWIEEELNMKEPFIGARLPSESMTVTSIAIAMAEELGCNPILLTGLDMAYTGGHRYAAGVGTGEGWKELDTRTAADRILSKKDRKGKNVYSAVRWVMESSSISAYAKTHPHVRLINTTDSGIGFKGIEYKPLASAIEEVLKAEFDLRGMIHSVTSQAPVSSEAKDVILKNIQELKESLLRCLGPLQILAGKAVGSNALAEMDLREEIAYSYLFYDMPLLLPQMVRGEPEKKWDIFFQVAQKYLQQFL